MTPTSAVAMLDRQLAAHGEDIRLQWLTAGPSGAQIPVEVKCRAFVRGYSPEQLIGGITQDQSQVTISPTEIIAQGWPGPALSNAAPEQDRRIPRKDARVFIKDKPRNVEAAQGIYLGGELVRIDMRVKG